jgi:hypothetical protein
VRVASWWKDLVMSDPARYLVLTDIPLQSGAFEAGMVLTEGLEVPVGWGPVAGRVDPLNESAVAAYHATRPTPPPTDCKINPQTYWVIQQSLPAYTLWRLTGLGVRLDPVGS